MDEVSGDVNDLVEVLKKNKDFLRWSKEDDIALEDSLSFENLAFQMLLRYKVFNLNYFEWIFYLFRDWKKSKEDWNIKIKN